MNIGIVSLYYSLSYALGPSLPPNQVGLKNGAKRVLEIFFLMTLHRDFTSTYDKFLTLFDPLKAILMAVKPRFQAGIFGISSTADMRPLKRPPDGEKWKKKFVKQFARGLWCGKPQGKAPVWATMSRYGIEKLERTEWTHDRGEMANVDDAARHTGRERTEEENE